jgi:aminopeptidase YwaD
VKSRLSCRSQLIPTVLLFSLIVAVMSSAQELLSRDAYRLIKENASGELPFADFRNIVRFSGYAPSPGSDQVAEYLAGRANAMGMSNVQIEKYPADGKSYSWAFRTEPSWEGREAELWIVEPDSELLASFRSSTTVLARQSRDADVTAALVDVGDGTRAQDYEGKNVEGRLILATGSLPAVTRQAIWDRKAAGVVYYRTANAIDYPDLFGSLEFAPWFGPHGEIPPFAFSLSYRVGDALRTRLAAGEKLVLHARVRADVGAGNYNVVRAEIPGASPELPAVLVYAHDNSRNTGGANNLTGVGCNLEVARVLATLIAQGKLPRPLRTIRFMWGPEHYGITEHFRGHPDDVAKIEAMVNVDMIGYSQSRAGAVFHLYRTPWSHPSFINDVAQEFVERIGNENTISIRNAHFLAARQTEGFLDPLFAPSGSREQFHYNIEEFWGPSDHEDAGEASIGLAAVLLNDFPDVFLGTQDDRPELAGDPTQMRRGVALVASSAYALASASAANAQALVHNSVTKGEARLAGDLARAFAMIDTAQPDTLGAANHDARNLVRHAYAREAASLASAKDVIGSQAFQTLAGPVLADWKAGEQRALEQIEQAAAAIERRAGIATSKSAALSTDKKFAAEIPVQDPQIRGPVNFFRTEYGRWWLIEKTGNEHFEQQVPLAKYGHYMLYEALNAADGKRNVSEIRDFISAEYQPVSVQDVDQYFRFLESVGVVHIKTNVATSHE